MRIKVIGGGPAGLYFSILVKKSFPQADIHVIERNKADDTFGFGVVFSDQTLDNFQKADRESYEAITRAFAYWDDIAIQVRDQNFRIGGNGFCGCSRKTLLMLLQERATGLGIKLSFEQELTTMPNEDEADLVVLADGLNSLLREANRSHFGTQVDLRPNRFCWMGSTRPFDAFTFFFKETEFGVFIAHCYQYEAGRSTWVLETDPETYAAAGLDAMTQEDSTAFLENVFKDELQGHRLIANRSIWRQFPTIRNKHCTMDGRVVLLGDAKSTAHFSIGSGTKLAMEDAISLHDCLTRNQGRMKEALADFESGRREEVEKTQHAAEVSLVWFEHVKRFLDFDPVQFAFGLMTRSKSITYDNLALRAPDFVKQLDKTFAKQIKELGHDIDVDMPQSPAFQPLSLRDVTLPNRLVVSPMCMYAANDGVLTDFHLVHYGSRAMGGVGLIFTEMTCISSEARITPGCAGLWTDEQQAAWTRIVDFVHQQSGAKICLQLGHAGRKGATRLMWDGMDRPLETGAWPLISASPLPYYPESQVPREMSRADMDQVRDQFVASVHRAEACGFDMVEMHAAHGYLLASFLSPVTNQRTDNFGGSLENRMRFPLDVFTAMRAAWPAHKPMSVRISATDWMEGGIDDEEAVEIARQFGQAGVDLVDVSTGQTAPLSRPVYGRMFQTPYSDQIRNEAHVATMCVGNITSIDQANTIVAAARADLVAFGRPHLIDPAFALRGAAWYGAEVKVPPSYAPGWAQITRNMPREKSDLIEMKLKARPKSHKPL